jgi:UDP-N-acetylmuramate dehydrogenase
LIEQAGLKGFSVNGAKVSEKHAGFLINTGNATAKDFFQLSRIIQDKVYQRFGVRLETEVQVL